MRSLLSVLALLLLPSSATAFGAPVSQTTSITIAGSVVNARTGERIAGATIRALGTTITTDDEGRFRLVLDRPGTMTMQRAGFATEERAVSSSDTSMVIGLFPLGSEESRRATAQSLERLTITAVRAGGEAPIAQTTLDRARIGRDYTGQDVPLTLRHAPSVTAYTESGSLLNYSYFRLRGIDQSRINITLDGVPLSEPEDQQIYFSDFPDLTSSIQSVQVQRGVGTSTYGQASFGGSVNFGTEPLSGSSRGASVRVGGGSFGTAMTTLEAQSGELPNRLAFSARVSGMRSDGYRDGATSAANSGFVSAGYFGDHDLLKFTATTGLERNGQVYTPVTRAELEADPRANPLAGVGDKYRESLAMLSWTRLLSPLSSLGVTGYGFATRGFYDYPSGAPGPALRFRSASRWGGLILAGHTTTGRTTLDLGAHGMTYSKDHEFDDVPDLQYPGYSNTGHKTEASAFAKARVDAGAATYFGDLQVRSAEFRYHPSAGYGLDEVSQRWTFVNPKIGATVRVTPRLSLFASFGRAGREPTRGDLFAGADDVTPDDAPVLLPLDRVDPEYVDDFEAGARLSLSSAAITVNAYSMSFRDEIARTGATTPLGYDIRANVGSSYRRGVEVDADMAMTSRLDGGVSIAVSRNRIKEYVDEGSGTTYRDIEPILTPTFLASHRLTWRATSSLTVTADGRYQGRTYLAPTGDDRLTTPPVYELDAALVVELGGRTLHVQGRNLLDRFALPSGDVSNGEPRYFILAPRSIDVSLQVRF